MAIFLDYYKFVEDFLPNYWQENDPLPANLFSLYEMSLPFFAYLYFREQMLVCAVQNDQGINYGLSNMESTVKAIATGTFPTLPVPSWPSAIFSQDIYETALLDFVGGIVNLPRFKVQIANIFTFDDPIRDILDGPSFISPYPLGGGSSADFSLIDITNKQYANFLLARILKFFGNPSRNAVINTVALVTQRPLSDVNLSLSGNTATITVNNIPDMDFELIKGFIEFRDNYDEPLYIEPSYGDLEFDLNYV